VAGIDEAGRGPLAGPVVAAAVMLPYAMFDGQGITDSKKLSAVMRASLFERLAGDASVHIGIGIVHAAEIDRYNILRATHIAMRQALAALRDAGRCPEIVLVDGLPVPDLHPRSRALIQGDSRSISIASASIIAKVTRDRMMEREYAPLYPEYDFARHKGYPTPDHLAALARLGPCPIHRRSFGPVSQTALRFPDVGAEGGSKDAD
jgi:ribonuclease HII